MDSSRENEKVSIHRSLFRSSGLAENAERRRARRAPPGPSRPSGPGLAGELQGPGTGRTSALQTPEASAVAAHWPGRAQALKPWRTSLPHPTSVIDGGDGFSQPIPQPGRCWPLGLLAQVCWASTEPQLSCPDATPLGGGGRGGPGTMVAARMLHSEGR
ncbi:uncharacterized protein LOC118144138 [Callithrix jacchus]